MTIHVNGCPNSCARFQVADIGLKGLVMTGASGETVEGFQVHLGGALGGNARLARKTRALRVEADDLVDYVEHVVTRFRTDQAPGESFAEWAHRADEEALR